jgi:hypothetical protein
MGKLIVNIQSCFQAKYDSFQLQHILGAPPGVEDMQQGPWLQRINDYGAAVVNAISTAISSQKAYVFLDSCLHHTFTGGVSEFYNNITTHRGQSAMTVLSEFMRTYLKSDSSGSSRIFDQGYSFYCDFCCDKLAFISEETCKRSQRIDTYKSTKKG